MMNFQAATDPSTTNGATPKIRLSQLESDEIISSDPSVVAAATASTNAAHQYGEAHAAWDEAHEKWLATLRQPKPIPLGQQNQAGEPTPDSAVEAISIEASTFADVQREMNRVHSIAESLRRGFESRSQYVQAKNDLDHARSAYDYDRQVEMDYVLQASPDYRAAVDARTAAQQAVSDAREHGASSDQLSILAKKSIAAMAAVTNLEVAALANCGPLQDDEARLTMAKSAMSQQEQEFQSFLADVHGSGDYQQAKLDLDKAKSNHLAAMANLQALDKDRAAGIAAQRLAELQAQMQSWQDQSPAEQQSAAINH